MPYVFKYYYGTIKGGKRAAKTNKKLYGKDFYREMGRKGGSACWITKGFAADPERAKIAGRLGGLVSRKGKTPFSLRQRRKMAKKIIEEKYND